MDSFNFTKTSIAALPYTDAGRKQYKDVEIDNLFLLVGKKTKTYYLFRKFRGRVKRIKIGDANTIVPTVARKKAIELLGQISMGNDPTQNKINSKSKTLGEVWDDFKDRRSLKPKTLKDYQARLDREFADWIPRPIAEITGDMVTKRHMMIGKRDRAYANGCMRQLRAIINFAEHEYVDKNGQSIIGTNPVAKLSKTRAWFPVKGRQSCVTAGQLHTWLQAVKQFHNADTRDYLLLVVLTGLRREEAAQLQWSNVDIANKSLTITDAKNMRYSGIEHVMPLSSQLYALLEKRHKNRELECPWVFPGLDSKKPANGYWKHIKQLQKDLGFEFSIHDLRRTFATVAESLDVSQYSLKRLLNHKMTGDVTAGYIVTSVERLRDPVQKIADKIFGETSAPKKDADTKSFVPIQ